MTECCRFGILKQIKPTSSVYAGLFLMISFLISMPYGAYMVGQRKCDGLAILCTSVIMMYCSFISVTCRSCLCIATAMHRMIFVVRFLTRGTVNCTQL